MKVETSVRVRDGSTRFQIEDTQLAPEQELHKRVRMEVGRVGDELGGGTIAPPVGRRSAF